MTDLGGWVPFSKRSASELRALAAEYRRMAASARTMDVVLSLHKCADRFEAMANRRERQDSEQAAAASDAQG